MGPDQSLSATLAGSTIGTALQRAALCAGGFDVALHFLKRVAALAADAFDTDAQIELKPVTIGNQSAANDCISACLRVS